MKAINWDSGELQRALKSLNWQNLPEISPAQKRYVHYYKIDFSDRHDGLKHNIGSFTAAGYQIAAQIFSQDNAKGTAILMHGYYDHVGIYGSLIEFCLQQGWNVFAFDLPGHGLSTGDRAAITDFSEYDQVFTAAMEQAYSLQKYTESESQPLHVFGQSTGGAIIINYLLTRKIQQQNSPFASINLLAPLVRPCNWASAKILHTFLSPFLKQIKRTFAINSNDVEFLRFIAEKDPLQPLALSVRWVSALKKWVRMIEECEASDLEINIVQGDQDGTVDWRHNMPLLLEKFPQRKLLMVEGGRHHIVNEDVPKRQQIYQWLQQVITR
ncbi:MAG: alpha/beta hydrolase [Oleispira antarctica]|uniref:Lysophospholipase n=1 Tax=Oleispira antarctica RB-8 TaxID=698738 RepID=R4YJM4_OLEAN|nr:alpha/beta hydrolase [Oleispira antarctica]MBQ0791306.1 alpha/beta hydrolase [Oleispira antarctica]CCK74295.1 Lysophospholipase [Oleispira antarctica RB-8]